MRTEAPPAINARLDPEAWKLDRRNRITGTDAAAIVGKHPYKSPLDVYLEKRGLAPEIEVNEAMEWGLRLEATILDAYAEKTGRSIVSTQDYVTNPAREWQAATLDAVADDGRIVEVKTVGLRSRVLGELGEEGTDEIPVSWLCQVQHQLAVTGRELADVAALVGGQEFRIYRVLRNDTLIARLTDREARFWDEHVLANVPPDPDRAEDADNFQWLYPGREGGVLWDGDETLGLLDEYQMLGDEIKFRESARKRIKADLLALLGTHERATTTDGREVVASKRQRAGYTVEPSEYLHFQVKARPGSTGKKGRG